MSKEIEAKFFVNDFASIREKLSSISATCSKPRTLMRRYTYTLVEKSNASSHEWARVRDEGDKITMAYKLAFDTARADGTEEIEIIVNDFDAAATLMSKLGFNDRLHQESYRETWKYGDFQITLDEWPVIGTFVEIEGPNEEGVRHLSANLGFDYATALFGGIGNLYGAKYGKDMGLVKELTFAKSEQIKAFLNS